MAAQEFERYRMYQPGGSPRKDWLHSRRPDANGRFEIRFGKSDAARYPGRANLKSATELANRIEQKKRKGYQFLDTVVISDDGTLMGGSILTPIPEPQPVTKPRAETGLYWDVTLPLPEKTEWVTAVEAVLKTAQPWLPASVGSFESILKTLGEKEGMVPAEPSETAAWAALLLLGVQKHIEEHKLLFTVSVAEDIDTGPKDPRILKTRNINTEKELFANLGIDLAALPDDHPFLQVAGSLGLYLGRPNLSSAPVENFWF
ncbi:MAG: hypothetical protein ACYDHY_19515 [Acidiferrobacterales bacterium]